MEESPTAFNFIALRNRIVPKASAYAYANPWALATPKSVRAEAIRDGDTAHKSNVAKRKKDACLAHLESRRGSVKLAEDQARSGHAQRRGAELQGR